MAQEQQAVLVVAKEFSSFGEEYLPGDEIAVERYSKWPEGVLATRLENGFLKHAVVTAEVTATVAEAKAKAKAILADADAKAAIILQEATDAAKALVDAAQQEVAALKAAAGQQAAPSA